MFWEVPKAARTGGDSKEEHSRRWLSPCHLVPGVCPTPVLAHNRYLPSTRPLPALHWGKRWPQTPQKLLPARKLFAVVNLAALLDR